MSTSGNWKKQFENVIILLMKKVKLIFSKFYIFVFAFSSIFYISIGTAQAASTTFYINQIGDQDTSVRGHVTTRDNIYYSTSSKRVHGKTDDPEHALFNFETFATLSGKIINSATLRLYVGEKFTNGDITLHRITNSWNAPQTTWNDRDKAAAIPWDTGGGDYDATNLGTKTITTTGWQEWDVQSTVQDWADGTNPEYGFIVTPDDTSVYIGFHGHPGANYPQLVVDYSNPTPPVVGYTADNTIPAVQVSQATNGSGNVSLNFRLKDAGTENCTLKTFGFSTNGGSSYSTPTGGDSATALPANWTDNGGGGYSSAVDFSGTIHSILNIDTQDASMAALNNIEAANIRFRFKANDGTSDSTLFAETENFTLDNLAPRNAVPSSPSNGATSVAISSSLVSNPATDISPVQYYIQVAKNSSFTSGLQESGWQGSRAFSPSLSCGTQYFWRVRARDSMGNLSNYSSTSNFTTAACPSSSMSSLTIISADSEKKAITKIAEQTKLQIILDNTKKQKHILKTEEAAEIYDQRPTFKGKTIPNATVEIFISSDNIIHSIIHSDKEGGWEYQVPEEEKLEYGEHKIWLRVTDADGNSYTTDKYPFRIIEEKIIPEARAEEGGNIAVITKSYLSYYLLASLIFLIIIITTFIYLRGYKHGKREI